MRKISSSTLFNGYRFIGFYTDSLVIKEEIKRHIEKLKQQVQRGELKNDSWERNE